MRDRPKGTFRSANYRLTGIGGERTRIDRDLRGPRGQQGHQLVNIQVCATLENVSERSSRGYGGLFQHRM